MKIRIIILILFIFVGGGSFSQQGFLGKKYVLSFGTSVNPPVFNNLTTGNAVRAFNDWSILPPKIKLSAGKVLMGRILLELSAEYQGLQNSGFRQNTGEYNSDTKTSTIKRDLFAFRTNTFNYGLNFNFFDEFAPIGRYFKLGVGYSQATSTIYPTFEVEVENSLLNINETSTEKREPGISKTSASYFTIGFGRTRLISRNILIDYGFKTSLYFHVLNQRTKMRFVDGYNYQLYFEDIVDHVVIGNLQSSNALEIFIKIGFNK